MSLARATLLAAVFASLAACATDPSKEACDGYNPRAGAIRDRVLGALDLPDGVEVIECVSFERPGGADEESCLLTVTPAALDRLFPVEHFPERPRHDRTQLITTAYALADRHLVRLEWLRAPIDERMTFGVYADATRTYAVVYRFAARCTAPAKVM